MLKDWTGSKPNLALAAVDLPAIHKFSHSTGCISLVGRILDGVFFGACKRLS